MWSNILVEANLFLKLANLFLKLPSDYKRNVLLQFSSVTIHHIFLPPYSALYLFTQNQKTKTQKWQDFNTDSTMLPFFCFCGGWGRFRKVRMGGRNIQLNWK